jgi:hypothetical protein
MAIGALFRFAQRAFFSKPAPPDPQLVALVKEHRITSIVELGIESLAQTQLLVATAVASSAGERVRYTGFDWFDLRPEGLDPLSLIATHRALAGSGASVKLAPGGPTEGLRSEANGLGGTQMVLLSRYADDQAMGPLWYLVPRMCSPRTLVLERVVDGGEDVPDWGVISLADVGRRAGAPSMRRAA